MMGFGVVGALRPERLACTLLELTPLTSRTAFRDEGYVKPGQAVARPLKGPRQDRILHHPETHHDPKR